MKNELDTGAKHLNQEAQYALRKSVIRLYKKGKKVPEIIEILGVSRAYVYGTIKKYNEEGIVAIKPHKRGRRTGEKRVLTPIQEKEIVAVIVDKNPEQLKLPGCMWTRKNICQLILRKYKIDIKASTLGYYLSRWGFSVQRPVKRAYNSPLKNACFSKVSSLPRARVSNQKSSVFRHIFFHNRRNRPFFQI